jgi:hypothetical protein
VRREKVATLVAERIDANNKKKKKKNKSLSNDDKMAGRRERTNKLNHIFNGHSTYSFTLSNSTMAEKSRSSSKSSYS